MDQASSDDEGLVLVRVATMAIPLPPRRPPPRQRLVNRKLSPTPALRWQRRRTALLALSRAGLGEHERKIIAAFLE